MSVRVRFAPSPTGFLHVGGARTAIFNWLYARHHGGAFVLRIEDTDAVRSSDEVVRAILDGMSWLGMASDEPTVFQSARSRQHVDDAMKLLASGKAYRCFCSAETLSAERAAAEKAGGGYVYGRRCLSIPRAVSDERAAGGAPFVVRLEVPPGVTSWDDAIHGTTSFDNAVIEDLILLRSDGSPTYNMSVVSDDLAMRITHVIRGDDHISNTPKQILIYRGLGQSQPVFGHLPLIFGTDKKRLSKRHGATSVLEYRDAGYLAEAMFNFLALLGWNPGDDRQKMDRDELIAAFDLGGVGRSGAVFDMAKLEWLNGLYIAALSPAEFAAVARDELVGSGFWDPAFDGEKREWVRRVLALIQPRAKTLRAISDEGRFFFDRSDEIDYDPAGVTKHLRDTAVLDALRVLSDRWAAVPEWNEAVLESALRDLAAQRGLKGGPMIHAVRLAATGRTASPGLFEVLALLGKERSLARLLRMMDRRSAGLL